MYTSIPAYFQDLLFVIGYEGLGSQDYGGMVLEMMDAIVLFPGGGGGGGGGGLL